MSRDTLKKYVPLWLAKKKYIVKDNRANSQANARENKHLNITVQNNSLSNHKIKLQFNNVNSTSLFDTSIHFCGPTADQLAQRASQFKE